MQIIVVDDGSTDGTADWLRRQADVVVVKGEGWGKPWGVNRAMAAATGAYLRFLDSDDWLNEGANEMQFALAERESADVVVSGIDLYHDETLIERADWIPTDDFIAQQLGEGPGSHYSAFLFRREFVQHIPHRTLFPASDFASRDDRCFVLEVALRKPRLAVSPLPALCHRFHDKGRLQFATGMRGMGTNIQQLYVFRQVLTLLHQRGELTVRRKRAALRLLWSLAHWIARAHLDDAEALVRWIYELDPQFRPPEKGFLGRCYQTLGFRATERILRLRRLLLART